MIYISHNLDDVLRLADDIVILRDGEVVGLGPKEEFDARRMILLMVGRDIEQLYPPRTTMPSNQIVLEVRHLSQSGVVHDVNFCLHKGEVLGIFGLMGSGRSELARILFGLESFETGQIEMNGHNLDSATPQTRIKKGMAFVTEDRRENGLLIEASILENVSLVALPKFARKRFRLLDDQYIRTEVKSVAEALHLKYSSLDHQPVRNLSGGNQQKAVIGKWLIQIPSVFIMDEPTRGIDVGAKFEVYTLVNDLAARGCGVLFISSEIEELMGMCDRILVMATGQVVDTFEKINFKQESLLQAAFRLSNVAREVYA